MTAFQLKGRLTSSFGGAGSPAHNANPALQMWVLGRPNQHGARNTEIVMLSWRTFVHKPGFAQLSLKRLELAVGAARARAIREAGSPAMESLRKSCEQCRAADGIHQHGSGADRTVARRSCRRHDG